MKKVLIGAMMGAAALAVSATGASAYMACSGNTCWHVKDRYEYPARAKIVVHEDSWKPHARVIIREHEGRGYWKGHTWTSW